MKKIQCSEQGDYRCKMAGAGFHSVVANRAQMCTADCWEENNLTADCHKENVRTKECHKANNSTADCHSQESKFESGLPRGIGVAICGTLESGLPPGYSCHGKPRYWSAVCHKRVKSSTSHFTLTVPLFAACIFLMQDLTSVKPISGGLFRPKQTTTGHS
jgi:hypothetical protein